MAQYDSGPHPAFMVCGLEPRHTSVDAWSTDRLSFPAQVHLRELRALLNQALRGLSSRTDQVLHAVYTSPVTSRCDTENILFYNVNEWGACFAPSARMRLRFERAFSKPPSAPIALSGVLMHHHRYECAPSGGTFRHWKPGRVLNQWDSVAFRGLAQVSNASWVWYRLRTASSRRPGASGVESDHIGVSLSIHAPVEISLNAARYVKPVIDGAIAACHVHNGSGIEILSGRLGEKFIVPAEGVSDLLMDDADASLGRRQLLWPWRDSVQWNPADDRCVAGEVLINSLRTDGAWGVSGALFEVMPS